MHKQGDHRDAFSNERHKVPRRPTEQEPSLKRSERQGELLFVMPVDSQVDSMFERSENATITHT